MNPTKNGGIVRIFIAGDWIQLKTVVLSEYLLDGNWIQLKTVVLSEYLLEETGSN